MPRRRATRTASTHRRAHTRNGARARDRARFADAGFQRWQLVAACVSGAFASAARALVAWLLDLLGP